jgi:hypothetical protein
MRNPGTSLWNLCQETARNFIPANVVNIGLWVNKSLQLSISRPSKPKQVDINCFREHRRGPRKPT